VKSNPYESPAELGVELGNRPAWNMLDIAALICAGAPIGFFGLFYFVLPAYVSSLPAIAEKLVEASFVTACLLCLASTLYSVVNAFKGRWLAVVPVVANAASIWSVVRNYL
jgi:hypothetical protein